MNKVPQPQRADLFDFTASRLANLERQAGELRKAQKNFARSVDELSSVQQKVKNELNYLHKAGSGLRSDLKTHAQAQRHLDSQFQSIKSEYENAQLDVARIVGEFSDMRNSHKSSLRAISDAAAVQKRHEAQLVDYQKRQREISSKLNAHDNRHKSHEKRFALIEQETSNIKKSIPKNEMKNLVKEYKKHADVVSCRLTDYDQRFEYIEKVFKESLQRVEEFNSKFAAMHDSVNGVVDQLQVSQSKAATADNAVLQLSQLNAQMTQVGPYLKALSDRIVNIERHMPRTPVVQ